MKPVAAARGGCSCAGGRRLGLAMAAFFIDRPVFAWVIAILIVLGGGTRHAGAAGRGLSRDRAARGDGVGRTILAPAPTSSKARSPR